jgi:hypothetical protein
MKETSYVKDGGVPGARVGARGARIEGILVTVLRKGCRSKRQPSYYTRFRVFEKHVEEMNKALRSGILDYNGILYHVRGWDAKPADFFKMSSMYGPATVYDVDLVEWNETPSAYISNRRKSPKSILDKVLDGEVDLG